MDLCGGGGQAAWRLLSYRIESRRTYAERTKRRRVCCGRMRNFKNQHQRAFEPQMYRAALTFPPEPGTMIISRGLMLNPDWEWKGFCSWWPRVVVRGRRPCLLPLPIYCFDLLRQTAPWDQNWETGSSSVFSWMRWNRRSPQ
jgi:hypothetical protein